MLDTLMMISVIGIVFGTLFFVYKATSKINCKYADNNIGKVIASFPVSHKMTGHIIRIGEKYYFCCESCGIIEVDYPANLDKVMDNPSFQSILAKQFESLGNKFNKK